VTLELWLLLSLTLLAGAMSPGPSVALVIRTSITHGRSSGLIMAVAHGLGIAVYALAVVLGLSTLIQNSSVVMTTLQICGALFLFYLGFQMLSRGIERLRKGGKSGGDESLESTAASVTAWQHAANGFLIVFFNPKVVIFFIAIFSQFLNADQTLATQLMAAAMAGGIDTAWYALVAVCVSNKRVATAFGAASPTIDTAFALLFMVFAAFVLLSL
jgi:threonine/homoserine/homoserine lactone efflux protein